VRWLYLIPSIFFPLFERKQLTLGVGLFFSIGVFRLTDPSGLETILECKEKEAFHPHPDLPIYTVRLSCFFFFLFFCFS